MLYFLMLSMRVDYFLPYGYMHREKLLMAWCWGDAELDLVLEAGKESICQYIIDARVVLQSVLTKVKWHFILPNNSVQIFLSFVPIAR